MGPAQSARRIQPGESRPAGAGPADPRLRLPSAPRAPARGGGPGGAGRRGDRRPAGGRPWPGAFPPRRCAATGSGSAGKASGGQVARRRASGGRVLEPPGSRSRRIPGPRERTAAAPSPPSGRCGAPLLLAGQGGPPARGGRGPGPAGPRRRCQAGRTALSAPRARGAAGPGAAAPGRPGSAAMSATHPTRLETRTKESSTRASQGPSSKARGAMKVRAGARRLRWDPGARARQKPRAHHRPVSPAPPGRGGGA